jgi:dTMP kinase
MKPGLFVSFEGIEGSGKSTQIARLSELLESQGHAHTITREPGGTAVGDGIRRILLDSETLHLTPAAELLLFYASRSQNLTEKIRPARARGEIVLCDRFFDASLAYQGYGRGIPLDFIDRLTDLVCAAERPDLTVLLDIEPGTGLERARARNSTRNRDEGRFEALDLAFFERVREGYLELARREPKRFRIVDANRGVDAIHRDVCALVGVDAARALEG